jgi:hypothetical protein
MRKSFFDDSSTQVELQSSAQSADAFVRWSAAVELGQLNADWAISELWKLQHDSDENTRNAAKSGLAHRSPIELAAAIGESASAADKSSQDYREWKIRPLPPLDEVTEPIYKNAILDILATEGPTVGSRIHRLTGSSMDPNNGFSISKNRLKKLLRRSIDDGVLQRHDFTPASDDLETSTYFISGRESVAIRPRGKRMLSEIPVTEVRAVLSADPRVTRRQDDFDFQFKILVRQYEIAENELFVVGGLLEREWLGLFSKASAEN